MDAKIISFFNKIFICLEKDKIKTFEEFVNPKIIYEIGLEIDNKLFSELNESITITGEDNLGIRISELTEIIEIFLNILKPPLFIATEKYKEEIELIDVIGLANKEHKTIYYFTILIIITLFYCENNEYFISKINNLEEDEKKYIYDLVKIYSNMSNLDKKEKKICDLPPKNNKNDSELDYKQKIEKLENELKEKDKKLKIVEEEYYNLKDKFMNYESKNTSFIKELNKEKNKNKELEKIIEEKNNKLGILQNKLDEKIKLIKERDTQLNKEIENNMYLNFKLNELNNSFNTNMCSGSNNKNNDYEKKYKEQLQINEELKNENTKLNDLISVMEIKLNDKNKDEIESDMNNIRINEEIEKKLKNCEKEKEDLKNQYEKEFELMSSAIYNLGFQFWSLKLEDSEKLKQNENWLVRERIKQYNGDY